MEIGDGAPPALRLRERGMSPWCWSGPRGLRDGGYMLGLAERPFFAPLTKRLLNREGERL